MQLIFSLSLFALAGTLRLSSQTGTNLEIENILSNHLIIQHHLSRRAIEWDTSDCFSGNCKFADGIQSQNESLKCTNCLAFVGLEGCMEIPSTQLVTNPDICYTIRVKYNVGSLNAEIVLNLGGRRRSILFPGANFDGTCTSSQTLGPYLKSLVGSTTTIMDVQVCGCFEDNCNVNKPVETTQLDIEQVDLPADAMDIKNLLEQDVFSKGLDGCIPMPKNLVSKNPEICMVHRVTARVSNGNEVTSIVNVGTNAARVTELAGSQIGNGECKKFSSKALAALSASIPPGASIIKSTLCVCKSNFCNRNL